MEQPTPTDHIFHNASKSKNLDVYTAIATYKGRHHDVSDIIHPKIDRVLDTYTKPVMNAIMAGLAAATLYFSGQVIAKALEQDSFNELNKLYTHASSLCEAGNKEQCSRAAYLKSEMGKLEQELK